MESDMSFLDSCTTEKRLCHILRMKRKWLRPVIHGSYILTLHRIHIISGLLSSMVYVFIMVLYLYLV